MRRRGIAFIALIMLSLVCVTPVLAAKPANNLAGAVKYPWYLSGEVMAVPPYGCRDIPGSDTASKLIVNQPNGMVEVTITGAMNGLHPDTVYTVYLSGPWTRDTKRWNLVGDWTLRFVYGGNYDHDMTVTLQEDPVCGVGSAFEGFGIFVPDTLYTWTVTGTVAGNAVSFHILYTGTNAGYYVDAVGTIADDGTMSGTWSNPSQSGTWSSTAGHATPTPIGSGWPGLFTSTVPPFTFATDMYGEGSWHVNLRAEDFQGEPPYSLSVWINEAGGTMLISDNFDVQVPPAD